MKQIRYYLLALLTVMMLVGCTEDNSMSEFKYPTEEQEGSVDEVLKALKAVPGIYNVQYAPEGVDIDEKNDDKKAGSDGKNEAKCYSFSFEQPVDHHNPQLGTYFQRCWLKFKSVDKNVVVLTHGYALFNYLTDMAKQLDANELHIEHRYFGESLPEPFEDLKMTYLDADQQARDIHNIVSALKQHFFKTGKWISTGTSKDGITTALQAYYSDMNGWKDFNVYVPFCAPFMTGTTYTDGTFSCNDTNASAYMRDVCGNGYPAGSKEAIAYERLRKIPELICTNQYIREAAIRACYNAFPDEFARVLEQYNNKSALSTGDKTKDETAYAVHIYYSMLFNKFSYVAFYTWAGIVPDLTPLINNTATVEQWSFFMQFITWDDKKLGEYLEKINKPKKAPATTRADEGSTPINTELSEEQWAFLRFRRETSSAPYRIQAFKELGYAEDNYDFVNGTGFLTAAECERVNYQFTNQYLYSQSAQSGLYKQDCGQLMTNFRKWVETEHTQPIIFVYAYNDPWTGAGIGDDTANNNPMIERVVDGLAIHNDYFLHRSFYTIESEKMIVSALNKFLGN